LRSERSTPNSYDAIEQRILRSATEASVADQFKPNANKPAAPRRGRPGSKVKLELMRNNQLNFVTAHHALLNGDRIAFRTAVNYEGYLTVTNIGASGKVNVLFAGRVSPTNDLRIPEKGWIRVTGKSGDEVVIRLPQRANRGDPRQRSLAHPFPISFTILCSLREANCSITKPALASVSSIFSPERIIAGTFPSGLRSRR
jgi:hypothetical protein